MGDSADAAGGADFGTSADAGTAARLVFGRKAAAQSRQCGWRGLAYRAHAQGSGTTQLDGGRYRRNMAAQQPSPGRGISGAPCIGWGKKLPLARPVDLSARYHRPFQIAPTA